MRHHHDVNRLMDRLLFNGGFTDGCKKSECMMGWLGGQLGGSCWEICVRPDALIYGAASS